MSDLIERILEEIEKGSLDEDNTIAYTPAFPLGLPHHNYLAEDEVTSVCRQHDSLVCLG
jgi:hypothetical protein